MTRSATAKPVTPIPVSTISPHTSWPMTTGGWIKYSLFRMWMSVPQMPALWTWMTT